MICACAHFEEHIWPHANSGPRGLLTLRTDAHFPCVRTMSSMESIFISDRLLGISTCFDYDRHDGVPQSTPLALPAFRSEKLKILCACDVTRPKQTRGPLSDVGDCTGPHERRTLPPCIGAAPAARRRQRRASADTRSGRLEHHAQRVSEAICSVVDRSLLRISF